MIKENSRTLNRAVVVSQLIYKAIQLPSYILDLVEDRIIEIPEGFVNSCLCMRLSRMTGIQVDFEHAYKRQKNACEMDTTLLNYCPYGLSAITVPVKTNNKTEVVISFGPILSRDPLEILIEQVYPRTDITIEEKKELAGFLYSMTQYDANFVNAFSQIIYLALNMDAAALDVFGYPINETQGNISRNYFRPNVVEAALHYISNNYTNDITLSDVAEKVFVHPSHLSRQFNQSMGISFRDYLNRLRIKKARHLLLDPSKTVSSICFEIGYSDKSYFNKVFKAIEGITPGRYREQNLPQHFKAEGVIHRLESPDKFRYLRNNILP